MPLSGAVGGRFAGDIILPLMGRDLCVEVKARADGFRELYSWLDGRDVLIVKADRREPLATHRRWSRHLDRGPYGIYVGMSHYPPAQRFDQHKAGIRAAGSVLKRGLEVLTGPTLHLQRITRLEARRIEAQLAAALADAGLLVEGGH